MVGVWQDYQLVHCDPSLGNYCLKQTHVVRVHGLSPEIFADRQSFWRESRHPLVACSQDISTG